jgi:hypothetical protein
MTRRLPPILFFFLFAAASAGFLNAAPVEKSLPVLNKVVFLPEGDLFRPLLADPKQPQFYMSYLGYRSDVAHFTAWHVGFGETLGIVRWSNGAEDWEGLQLNMMAGVLAQFNWSAESRDLINADYIVGPTLTGRRGPFGARLRLFHQSSHLGDELLLSTPIARVNLSFEALDLMADVKMRHLRIYGGGGYLVSREPRDLKRNTIQAGTEFLGASTWFQWLRPIAALDLKWSEQQRWRRNISLKAGWELGSARYDRRHLRFFFEFYNGFSPFGQFFNAKVQYIGGGLYIGI